MMTRTAALHTPMTGVERVESVLDALGHFPLSIPQFLLRLSIGAVFWHSGMTKIASWDTTLALFRDEYMVPIVPPELAAGLAATIELTCPVLLVLGLATRLATLPMLGMTLVIEVFVYPEQWVEHLMWASILVLILTRGPGVLSVDHLISRRFLGDRQGGQGPWVPLGAVFCGKGGRRRRSAASGDGRCWFCWSHARPTARHGACEDHGDRPPELSLVPAAALPGGNRWPIARRHRDADPEHSPPPEKHHRSAGPGDRCRQGGARRRDGWLPHSL